VIKGAHWKCFLAAVLALAMVSQIGCSRRQNNHSNTVPGFRSPEFVELKAGSTVQVVIPITKSGSYVLPSLRQKTSGNNVDLEAGEDFDGYEKALYKVRRLGDDGIQIRFSHAEDWEHGKRSSRRTARLSLFEDLTEFRHIRLVYLTRESQADHNMAVVASKDADALKASTDAVTRLAQCQTSQIVVCKWVPEGVAVTVENRK
jgi:hypothetical protein